MTLLPAYLPAFSARKLLLSGFAWALLGVLAASSVVGQELARAVDVWTTHGHRKIVLEEFDPSSNRLPGLDAEELWLEIRLPGQVAPRPAGWELELAGGTWLPGAPGGGEGDWGWWRLAGGTELRFDTVWLRALQRRGRPYRAKADQDFLWLETPEGPADRRKGWFLGWFENGLAFEDVAGEHRHPWTRVQALQILDEAVAPVPGNVWVVLAGGGHFAATWRLLDRQGRLHLELPWQGSLTLPLNQVAALYPRRGTVQSLAERPPRSVQGPASKVLDWSPKQGRSVEGGPLQVGNRGYPTGFGTRVPSEIRYRVSGPGTFFAQIGVDDEVASFRNPQPVRFRLLLDGRELWSSGEVRFGEAARTVRVALDQGGELELRTEAAGRLPFGGHANWLCPMWLPGAPSSPRDSG